MTAAEFQAAGLYDPAAPPARLELLEWLAAQGVTLADMREAQLRWGALSGLAGDLALRAGERLTLAEVAARSGMSPERIERFDLAAGFPPVGPEERVFDPGTAAMFASFAAAEQFFGQGPLLHFIRVLGSSVAHIAEAAVSLFLANVEAAIVERGASELAVPRDILATAEVASAAARDRFRFEPAGRRLLKGFDAPVALYAVARP